MVRLLRRRRRFDPPDLRPLRIDEVPAPPAGAERSATADVEMVRRAERADVRLRWVAGEQVRVRTRIVTEEVTRTVLVRREELVVEPVAPGAMAGTDPTDPSQPADPEQPIEPADPPEPDEPEPLVGENVPPLEIVLHREEVVLGTRVVPYSRVRVGRRLESHDEPFSFPLSREDVFVDRQWAWAPPPEQSG